MSDVFIAHVEDDVRIALEIALGLEEAGYLTWCYEIDSVPGPPYLMQTGEAISECRAILVIVSPRSLGSNQVTNEIIRAYEDGKNFIPVLYGVSDADFKKRQPIWRQCMGAATSINIPLDGVVGILDRLAEGLNGLGIPQRSKHEAKRIDSIQKVLSELMLNTVAQRTVEQQEEVAASKAGIESIVTNAPFIASKLHYNRFLLFISGLSGFAMIWFAVMGFLNYAEVKYIGYLVEGVLFSFIFAPVFLLMAIIPERINSLTSKLKIRLEKWYFFLSVLFVLELLWIVALAMLMPY